MRLTFFIRYLYIFRYQINNIHLKRDSNNLLLKMVVFLGRIVNTKKKFYGKKPLDFVTYI